MNISFGQTHMAILVGTAGDQLLNLDNRNPQVYIQVPTIDDILQLSDSSAYVAMRHAVQGVLPKH